MVYLETEKIGDKIVLTNLSNDKGINLWVFDNISSSKFHWENKTDISNIEDQVLSMYAKGMTNRAISAHLRDVYGVEASAEMISRMLFIPHIILSNSY